MTEHCEDTSGARFGAFLAVWVMKVGRNPCLGAVEQETVLPPDEEGAFLG